jgi:tetratricopeptide (TPR) repeat protein
MRRKWLVLPVLVFGLIALSVGTFAAWSARASARFAISDEEESGAADAQLTVQSYVRSCSRGREAGYEWFTAEVTHAARCRNLSRLVVLCRGEEGPFKDDEEAALLACRGLVLEDKWAEFQRVRDLWHGREHSVGAWLLLDADVLLREGRPREARALLVGRNFAGLEEGQRLARLALAEDDERDAYDLLARALALAPDDPDVRDCRGRLCESEGRIGDAVAEFAAGLATRPDDLVLRDRLAECYRRSGNYEEALATWLPDRRTVPAEFVWFKAWFWNRVGRPATYDWESMAPDSGPLQPLAEFLVSLPPGEFWRATSEYGRSPRGALERQETYWLRVLAMLKAGQDREAAYMIRTGPFHHVSWASDLEDALDRVLTLRAGNPTHAASVPPDADLHPFYRQLQTVGTDASVLPDDMRRLIGGEEAFSAVLLAAGWDEAALLLHRPNSDLSVLPPWFGDRLIRVMWKNRGTRTALAAALQQPHSAVLDLVIGELLLAEGRGTEALERFRTASASPEAAPRAAWLFALEALRQKRPTEARQMLDNFPALTSDVAGQALLARCAAAEGNDDRAERLYREIVAESIEARDYLSRRAVAAGDWAAVGRITGVLAPAGKR